MGRNDYISIVKRGLIIFGLLMYGWSGRAQELITNGDFEEHTHCQENRLDVTLPSPWLHTGSPDFFMEGCVLFSPEHNPFGTMQVKSGNAFAGLSMDIGSSTTEPTERLIAPLKHPLEAGKVYRVNFYVSLAANSVLSIRKIAVWLPQELSDTVSFNQLLIMEPSGSLIPGKWIQVSAYFRAKGREKYMAIGNFLDSTNFIKTNRHLKAGSSEAEVHNKCYLFIDSVSMTPADISQVGDTTIPGLAFATTTINFRTGKAILSVRARTLLSNIVRNAGKMNDYAIDIIGYTDSSGREEKNLVLARQRAEAVKNYLVNAGLKKQFITARSMGSLSPVAPNNTSEGRSQNRRTEIKLTRKYPFPVLSAY